MIRALRKACLSAMLAVPLAACGGNWQSALDVHGTSAISLKHLIVLIVAVCSVVWMLVMVALIVRCCGTGATAGRPDLEPRRERRMTIAVIGAVVATVVIIGTFTIMSFFATRALSVAGQDDLTIRVRGLQWWWGLEYIGPDPSQRFETANEIHIPVGRNVRLKLEGLDVIHSFWVPSLAGKQDLIPGRSNELTIRAEHAGVYRGQCAEFCGMQHAHMALLVIAGAAGRFRQMGGRAAASGGPAGRRGDRRGHADVSGKALRGLPHHPRHRRGRHHGPDLTHVGSRRTIAAGLFETTRGSLAAWIADPQTIKPGNNMPMVPLTPDELRAVSAYMASLK